MTEIDKLDAAINIVRQFAPTLTITQKSSSWGHNFVGRVLGTVGNKQYMKSYVTTIGTNIAIPTNGTTWSLILHEGRHIVDSLAAGKALYSVAYLFPQIIGIIGAIVALPLIVAVLLGAPLSWLFLLLSLVFLGPLPAPFRALIEARAYTLTLAVLYWANAIKDEQKIVNALVKTFSDSCYYWMWPFKNMVRKYFEGKLAALKTGSIELDPYLAACRELAQKIKSTSGL